MRDYFILAKQFTLGKEERLKSRKQTERLFSSGKKFSSGSLRVIFQVETVSTDEGLLFGAGVSTKNFKKATDRNRIKRLIRESYRLQKPALQKQVRDHKIKLPVFFIYTGKQLPSYQEVFESMEKALHKLETVLFKS